MATHTSGFKRRRSQCRHRGRSEAVSLPLAVVGDWLQLPHRPHQRRPRNREVMATVISPVASNLCRNCQAAATEGVYTCFCCLPSSQAPTGSEQHGRNSLLSSPPASSSCQGNCCRVPCRFNAARGPASLCSRSNASPAWTFSMKGPQLCNKMRGAYVTSSPTSSCFY